MALNARSASQQMRHAEARKAQDDRRQLVELLVRHESTLKGMLREIRVALKSADVHGYIRATVRPTRKPRGTKSL